MTSTGTIVARVYTAQAQLPIESASVAFTQKTENGRQTLLAIRVSDENGKTAPVRISTPDAAQSASPGAPAPFSLCDLWAEAQGYELILVEDVQIFPDTETVQELELIPLPEHIPPAGRTEVVRVTPQDL